MARKFVTTQLNWADDEWDKKKALEDLEREILFALDYKHFIDVPSESEIKENGIDVGEMFSLQMRKIEQIYKYLYELKRKMII